MTGQNILNFIFINIGLIFNLLGTILVAISVGPFPKEWGGSTTGSDGKEYNFAYITHPKLFKVGLIFILLGFLLQLRFN